MYELYIEDKNKVFQLADLGDTVPAMTYQSNDIADLQDRNNSFSMTMKLPKSPNNCQIFDYSHQNDSISDYPYEMHNCRLYSNGYTLAGNGFFLVVRSITEYHFECQIKSGIVTFFDLLKSKSMEELDLGSMAYGVVDFEKKFRNHAYTIPAATYQISGDNELRSAKEFQLPAIFVKHSLEEIVVQNNYSFKSNLVNNQAYPDFENLALSIADVKPYKDSILHFYGEARSTRIWKSSNFEERDIKKDANKNLAIREGTLLYTCQFDGSLHITYEATFRNYSKGTVQIINVIKNLREQDAYYTESPILEKDSQIKTPNFEIVIEVQKGDEIGLQQVFIPLHGQAVEIGCVFEYEINEIKTDTVPIGGILYFAPNMGFTTQFDYFKTLLQLLGLTINVDEGKKIVELYTMERLYNNRKYALDWTDKLHNHNRTKEFTIRSYGQENFIKFEDNSEDNITNQTMFRVENRTLEAVKNLFTIPIRSGGDYSVLNYRKGGRHYVSKDDFLLAHIPLIEIDNDGKTKIKAGKPQLLLISEATYVFKGKFWIYPLSYTLDVWAANHYTIHDMVNTYYKYLIECMLKSAKLLKAEFLLENSDIENYLYANNDVNSPQSGMFTPVYLQQYGKCFFVNKISNYQTGKLTKVELIKITVFWFYL